MHPAAAEANIVKIRVTAIVEVTPLFLTASAAPQTSATPRAKNETNDGAQRRIHEISVMSWRATEPVMRGGRGRARVAP